MPQHEVCLRQVFVWLGGIIQAACSYPAHGMELSSARHGAILRAASSYPAHALLLSFAVGSRVYCASLHLVSESGLDGLGANFLCHIPIGRRIFGGKCVTLHH